MNMTLLPMAVPAVHHERAPSAGGLDMGDRESRAEEHQCNHERRGHSQGVETKTRSGRSARAKITVPVNSGSVAVLYMRMYGT
jgi:hypothetical protein